MTRSNPFIARLLLDRARADREASEALLKARRAEYAAIKATFASDFERAQLRAMEAVGRSEMWHPALWMAEIKELRAHLDRRAQDRWSDLAC